MDYIKNAIIQKDLDDICSNEVEFHALRGKTILVTGATGMIASYLVYTLLALNERGFGIKIIVLARNAEKLQSRYGELIKDGQLTVIQQDVCDPIMLEGMSLDYIFHLAGSASPKAILANPVGIIKANTLGLMNVMELAREKGAKVMFVSTREVYGAVDEGVSMVSEGDMGVLDTLNERACYPESKRIAETICKSYAVQYGVSYVVLRVAHSYGPFMELEGDGRVMADFIADAVHGRNIIMKSRGDALRSFIYVADTVSGMFKAVLARDTNQVYNLSNEMQELSVKCLAEKVLDINGNKSLEVKYLSPTNEEKNAYTHFKRVGLNTSKIEGLGWQPRVGLDEGIGRTLAFYDRL